MSTKKIFKDKDYKTVEELIRDTGLGSSKVRNSIRSAVNTAKEKEPDIEWERPIIRNERKRNGFHYNIANYLTGKKDHQIITDRTVLKQQSAQLIKLHNQINDYQYQIKYLYDQLKERQKNQISFIKLISQTINELQTKNKQLAKENATLKIQNLNMYSELTKLLPEEQLQSTDEEIKKQENEWEKQLNENPLPEYKYLWETPKETLFPDLTTEKENELLNDLKKQINNIKSDK